VHSNPILTTFCSLLYYKDLSKHLRLHKIEKLRKPLDESLKDHYELRPSRFTQEPEQTELLLHPFVRRFTDLTLYKTRKTYNKRVVNKWHLLVRLSLNIELTVHRKHRIRAKSNSGLNVFQKIKNNLLKRRNLVADKAKPDQEKDVEMRF
jgi:hypothetical protein